MKRIDFAKPADFEQIYELFLKAQVRADNCSGKPSGFYEYPLSEAEMKKRIELSAQEKLGLVIRDGDRIIAYSLAYRANQATELDDEVLRRVSVPNDAVYADQLFIEPSLPIYVAGRMVDAWDNTITERYSAGIFSAVPWKPWKNVSAARFNFSRGGEISGFLSEKSLDLAIFTKPFCRAGKNIPKFEIEIRN